MTMKLILAVAFLPLLTACTQPKTVSAAPETVSGVQVATVENKQVIDAIDSVGTVHAAQEAQLSAQMMGTIVSVNVREGDRVHRGQVLVVLEDSQPRAGVDRAEAAMNAAQHETQAADSNYALAQSTLKRFQTLYDRKSVSPQEFDEMRSRAQSAEARRDSALSSEAQAKAAAAQARTTLEYTRIRSPFDGIVTVRRMDPGTLATPGMPILTVEAGGRFRLEADVDEGNLSIVRVGETLPVRIDAIGTAPLNGRVVQVLPAANPSSRSFVVKIELPSNAQIRSGLFGRAEFARGSREALSIPRSALMTRGQMQSVFIVGSDNIARLRYVTVSPLQTGEFEVLSGLVMGDRVILAPGERELGGKKIEVTR
jgi:RND family efflux transporter MFP subunit